MTLAVTCAIMCSLTLSIKGEHFARIPY